MLLRPEILDYWRGFDGSRGLEADSIVERVDPAPVRARRLLRRARATLRVSRVRGTRDPRRGRLVLTGWFSAPRPSAVGGFAEDGAPSEEAAEILDAALAVAYDAMDELELARVAGLPRRARGGDRRRRRAERRRRCAARSASIAGSSGRSTTTRSPTTSRRGSSSPRR